MSRTLGIMIMLSCLITANVHGQYNTSTNGWGDMFPSIPESDAPPAFDDNVPSVPVDGGMGLLLAAGIGYGVNWMRKRKQDKQDI